MQIRSFMLFLRSVVGIWTFVSPITKEFGTFSCAGSFGLDRTFHMIRTFDTDLCQLIFFCYLIRYENQKTDFWFHWNDVIFRISRDMMGLLRDNFESRFTGGDPNLPPRSCDLIPCNLFLWGFKKSIVYTNKSGLKKILNVSSANLTENSVTMLLQILLIEYKTWIN